LPQPTTLPRAPICGTVPSFLNFDLFPKIQGDWEDYPIPLIGLHVQEVNYELSKHYAMKAYRGVDVSTHVFLTSALVGDEWSASRPGLFTPGEEPLVSIG
jgi:hypothetical protein